MMGMFGRHQGINGVHGSEWDQACKGMKVVQNHRRHNRNPVTNIVVNTF